MNGIFDFEMNTAGFTGMTPGINPNPNNIDQYVSDGIDKIGSVSNKLRGFVQNKRHLTDSEMNWWPKYKDQTSNVGRPRGVDDEVFKKFNESKKHGTFNGSLVNKVHIMRVGQIPASDKDLASKISENSVTFSDLCRKYNGVIQYDPDDFLYCSKLGLPVNRLITLRRFPYGVTDNIYDKYNQSHPDIARMVTFFTNEVNKLEEILSFSFGLKWKELTAEMEQHSMLGDQSGLGGFMGRIMKYIDPVLANNKLQGENALNYNPTFDQNKVYGPVDSINSTHIRDVGMEFSKEFTISFEYELRSYSGRTPEYAMRDIIANALAVTYNNAKFWGGARYWVGERPTQYLDTFQGILNPSSVNQFVEKARTGLKGIVADIGGKSGGSKIQALKNAMSTTMRTILKNAMSVGIGKILDSVGRASIITSNSLLSGEPIGNWHLTVGNPDNPILCIGNLMCTGMEIKFPTDELSYGEFPTKVTFEVRLKPGMAKDKAGIETMFNMGRQRIYHNPKKITIQRKNLDKLSPSERTERTYSDTDIDSVDSEKILHTFNETFDFMPLTQTGTGKEAKVSGKNVELIIDGTEYKSTTNYDEQLIASSESFPDYANDKKIGDDFDASQQQNNKIGTMNGGIGGSNGPYSGNYQTNVIGNPTTKRITDTIKQKESGNNYRAQAKTSTASGAYQFVDDTWQSLTKKYGIGTEFSKAKLASPEIQDMIAAKYVEEIMRDNNGDVSKVPLVWFTGNKYGQMSKAALKANRGLNAQKYQNDWISVYNTKK